MNAMGGDIKENSEESSMATPPLLPPEPPPPAMEAHHYPITMAQPIYNPSWPWPPFYYPAPMLMPPPPFQSAVPFIQPTVGMDGYGPYNMNALQTPLTRAWSTQIFDCFSDLKSSFITFFLPCVTFGKIAEIINEGQTTWWEHAVVFGLCDIVTLSQGSLIYSCYYRTKMRNKFVLNGNICLDFFINFFCMKLSLCQQYRQLHRMGFDVGLGWQAYLQKQRINAMEAAIQCMPPRMDPGMFR